MNHTGFDAVSTAIMARLVEDEVAGVAQQFRLGESTIETHGEWNVTVFGKQFEAHARHRHPRGDWELGFPGRAPLVDRFVWQPGDDIGRIEWHTGEISNFVIAPLVNGYKIESGGGSFEVGLRAPVAVGSPSPLRGGVRGGGIS